MDIQILKQQLVESEAARNELQQQFNKCCALFDAEKQVLQLQVNVWHGKYQGIRDENAQLKIKLDQVIAQLQLQYNQVLTQLVL